MQYSAIPNHVGIIMDGNGRWAQARGLDRCEGHRMAAQALYVTVETAARLGVQNLSLYAFSSENWTRPKREVDFLLKPQEWLLPISNALLLSDLGVSIKLMGDLNDHRLTTHVFQWVREVEAISHNQERRLTLNIAFNYGAKQEIVRAVQRMIEMNVTKATPDILEENFWLPDTPDLDLIIRTSGEQRLSNFMLWKAAYAELIFVRKLWPDFTGTDLIAALHEYTLRRRRWGGLTGPDLGKIAGR